MQIPTTLKQTIGAVFYDKTVTRYISSSSIDNEGWARETTTTTNGTFLGNVNFNVSDQIQKNYGQDASIDITITTNQLLNIGEIIDYLNQKYKINRILKYDSHYMVLAMRWYAKASA